MFLNSHLNLCTPKISPNFFLCKINKSLENISEKSYMSVWRDNIQDLLQITPSDKITNNFHIILKIRNEYDSSHMLSWSPLASYLAASDIAEMLLGFQILVGK